MKLDINEIKHQYVIRIVILALFIYKRLLRQPNVYKNSVISYVKKRIFWKIDLVIDTGIKLNKEEERDIILDQILNDVETDYLTEVTATFTTPLKEVTIEVDLSNEKKYEEFLYS